MKAWIVQDDCIDLYEERAIIVFNDDEKTARQIGADRLATDIEYVVSRRAEEFDRYAAAGKVSPENLVKNHGWFWGCAECGGKVHEDEENLETAVFVGDDVYCTPGCRAAKQARIARVNEEFERFQIAVMDTNYEIVGFEGGWPVLTPRAFFTFPGAKYSSCLQVNLKSRQLECFVAHGDLEAYGAWCKTNR